MYQVLCYSWWQNNCDRAPAIREIMSQVREQVTKWAEWSVAGVALVVIETPTSGQLVVVVVGGGRGGWGRSCLEKRTSGLILFSSCLVGGVASNGLQWPDLYSPGLLGAYGLTVTESTLYNDKEHICWVLSLSRKNTPINKYPNRSTINKSHPFLFNVFSKLVEKLW